MIDKHTGREIVSPADRLPSGGTGTDQPNVPDEPGRQNDQPLGTGPMAASVPSDCSPESEFELVPPPPLDSGSDKFRFVPAVITLTAVINGKEYPGDLPGYVIEDLVDPPLSFAELCAEANRQSV